MTDGFEDRDDRSPSVWAAEEEVGAVAFDEDCSPTRVCRNAREFSFDGIATEGRDLSTAWRERLEREGKLNRSAESIRDLVLGQTASD
jgi:hypothetical protein